MTMDEIRGSPKDVLTLEDVGCVVRIAPIKLRDQAQKEPKMLGFPVVVANGTVRVPRKAFIRWMDGD